MLLCAANVLIVDNYYKMLQSAKLIASELEVYIFLKNTGDELQTVEYIESLDLIKLAEYVPSKEVYQKAIQENPFLSQVAVADANNAFPSYIAAFPAQIPTDKYIKSLEDTFYNIEGVDELVFDRGAFLRYAEISDNLKHYRMVGFALIGAVSMFFLIAFILALIYGGEKRKNFFFSFVQYLIASIIGFWALWGYCSFFNYALSADQISSLLVIPFTAFLGTVMKE
jgi:cell division protein FtsX